VLEALLPGDDYRARQLLMQAKDPPEVRRQLVGVDGYRLTIPHVKDGAYCIDLERDLDSPLLHVRDSMTGRKLTFAARILRGGFLYELAGTAEDGQAWPLAWHPMITKSSIVNWLPQGMDATTRLRVMEELATWCDIDIGILRSSHEGLLRISGPASSNDISMTERRLGVGLPAAYRHFVEICDGFEILYGRPYVVCGTRDVYSTQVQGMRFLVITELYENGVVAIDPAAGPGRAVVLLRGEAAGVEVIGSLREHVRDSLGWLKDFAVPKGK